MSSEHINVKDMPMGICPICLDEYLEGYNAISRFDNETKVCPRCGTLESFVDLALNRYRSPNTKNDFTWERWSNWVSGIMGMESE